MVSILAMAHQRLLLFLQVSNATYLDFEGIDSSLTRHQRVSSDPSLRCLSSLVLVVAARFPKWKRRVNRPFHHFVLQTSTFPATMPHDERAETYATSRSQFLLPTRSPSRQGILKNRRSTTSLRGSPNLVVDEDAAGRHSLAHELAVALMPEPSSGSRLLAEEFGIEYDEGAEGIDHDMHGNVTAVAVGTPSLTEELASQTSAHSTSDDGDSEFGELKLGNPETPPCQKQTEADAMEILALNLKSTDKFLSHLRHLDIDSGSSTAQPPLEKIASDMIRHLNDTTRDREGQVRALLGYEREFRRIAGEIGGSEVLGQLDELPQQDDLSEQPLATTQMANSDGLRLESITEEEQPAHLSNDWETDPDLLHLDDEDDESHSPSHSPTKDTFSPPPIVDGPPTAAKSIPQLVHLRSFTASLVTSLSTISEQAQVNGAATTEAGRKIRALKNKLGGWRTDWDSAERSRVRIEKWEAGLVDGDITNGIQTTFSRPSNVRRIDGRKVVEEHLQAFEQALADAALKTKAIMAS